VQVLLNEINTLNEFFKSFFFFYFLFHFLKKILEMIFFFSNYLKNSHDYLAYQFRGSEFRLSKVYLITFQVMHVFKTN
jgi:hypothetical protein